MFDTDSTTKQQLSNVYGNTTWTITWTGSYGSLFMMMITSLLMIITDSNVWLPVVAEQVYFKFLCE